MAVVSGTGSPAFSGQNPQLLQQSNYFRRGSDRLQLGSNWVKPILDEMFAQNIIGKVLPYLNRQSASKLSSGQIVLLLAPDTWQFGSVCENNGLYNVDTFSTCGVSTNLGNRKLIIMNPLAIARKAEGSEKANISSFILTLIHELTHMTGAGFDSERVVINGQRYRLNLSPLNEGFTERYARDAMKELFPKEFKANKDKYYHEYVSIIDRMLGLADPKLLQGAFFEGPYSRKLQAYVNQISQLDSKSAFGLFQQLNKIGESIDAKEELDVKAVVHDISEHLTALEKARSIQLARQKRQQEMANLANSAKDKCIRIMNFLSGRNYDSANLSIRLAWGNEVFAPNLPGSPPPSKVMELFIDPPLMIDAKQIENACGSSKRLQNAYIVKEVFARLMTNYGNFPMTPGPISQTNNAILNSGYPYLYAKRLMRLAYPFKYLAFRKWSSPEERITKQFVSVMGKSAVLKAFHKSDLNSLSEKLIVKRQKVNRKLLSAIADSQSGRFFDPVGFVSLIRKAIILDYPFTEASSLKKVSITVWDDKAWNPITKDIQNLHAEHIGNLRIAKQQDGSLKIKGSMGFLLRSNDKIYIDKSLLDARQLKLTNVNEFIDYVVSWHLNQSSVKFKLTSIEDFVLKGLGAYFYQDFILKNNLPIVSSSERDRNAILGKKIVDIFGRESSERLIFSPDRQRIRLVFEQVFGKKALNIFDNNYSFFDEPITNFAMAVSVLSKKSKVPMLGASKAKTTITFGEFSDEFKDSPYKASLKLITTINPGINDEVKSILATNALYLSHAVGRFGAETVALAIMSFALTNSRVLPLSSLYPASFIQTAGATPRNQVPHFVHYAVMRNIVSNKPLFEGIENDASLLASYRKSLSKAGTGFSYAKTAEMLKAARTNEFQNYVSIFANDPELNTKIKAYIDKLCRQYSSNVFSSLYSRPGFKEAYNGYLEKMLTDFVLGINLAMQPDVLETRNNRLVDNIVYVEVSNGVYVPIMHPKSYELKSNSNPTVAFAHAFASMLSRGVRFDRNAVIGDASSYRDLTTDLWIKNVLADTSSVHTFFDIANRGSESCASRFFVSL